MRRDHRILPTLLLLGACGAPEMTGNDGSMTELCTVGATRCAGLLVQTCATGTGFSAAAECAGDPDLPRNDACADPTPAQREQADAAADYATMLVDHTGWSLPLDGPAIGGRARRAILKGDGSDGAYYQALWDVLLSVPQGHQGMAADKCDEPGLFYQEASRLGACGVAHDDGLLVTYAETGAGNPLGLVAGDLIVTAGEDRGVALVDAAWRRPTCGNSVPSQAGQRAFAAASFFGTVPRGMVLTVRPGDGGAERKVTVPTADGHVISCQDVLGRDILFDARASVRADGVAVIRLPRFYPLAGGNPMTQEEVDAFIAAFQAKVQAEFDKVKTAPAIVWDARGNGGGITLVGLAIVGGMPGAQALALSHCTGRIPGTSPPEFNPVPYAQYAVTPGGPFAYGGKAAVIIDGLDYSAADYFALAVKRATTVPLVGATTSGAYGGPGPYLPLAASPTVSANYDVNRCVDAVTGEALEGKPTAPTLPVQYAPADLRAGIDTVLEAAVATVK